MYFYHPTNNISQIDEEYTDHFFSMRVKIGDIILTTDLDGLKREIKITEIDKKSKTILFKILESSFENRKIEKNILFQAITDKIYLDKLVEIAPHANVDIIYLFYSERSPTHNFGIDRLERIIYRSCEQAQKLYKPDIEIVDQISLAKLLDLYRPIVLEISHNTEALMNPENNYTQSVLVGPEGGWSTTEKNLYKKKGLLFESLGSIVYPAWLAGYTWFIKNTK
ncbi:MAG: RsmE family RNA methyltransferase [candidate division SR1 bacterium]|nr:RsmE family RNA methyltransferase [candidate division SR1 bacterium]